MCFRLFNQTGKQLVQMDIADVELLFDNLCREMVEHNQIIAHDDDSAFILCVVKRMCQLFL